MKIILPFLLLFAGLLLAFYLKKMSGSQKKWIATLLGLGFIALWIYVLSRFL